MKVKTATRESKIAKRFQQRELLEEIRLRVEEVFNVNIKEKSRKQDVVRARRCAVWFADRKRCRPVDIEDVLGVRHDTQVHYRNTAKQWVKMKDPQMLADIYTCFNTDVGITNKAKQQELERLSVEEALYKQFQPLILQLPKENVEEALYRFEVMVKGYSHKHTIK